MYICAYSAAESTVDDVDAEYIRNYDSAAGTSGGKMADSRPSLVAT